MVCLLNMLPVASHDNNICHWSITPLITSASFTPMSDLPDGASWHVAFIWRHSWGFCSPSKTPPVMCHVYDPNSSTPKQFSYCFLLGFSSSNRPTLLMLLNLRLAARLTVDFLKILLLLLFKQFKHYYKRHISSMRTKIKKYWVIVRFLGLRIYHVQL